MQDEYYDDDTTYHTRRPRSYYYADPRYSIVIEDDPKSVTRHVTIAGVSLRLRNQTRMHEFDEAKTIVSKNDGSKHAVKDDADHDTVEENVGPHRHIFQKKH